MKACQKSLLISLCLFLVCLPLFLNASSLQKEIRSIEKEISKRKAIFSAKDIEIKTKENELVKKIRNTQKLLARHQKKSESAQGRVRFLESNLDELDSWYQDLGGIEQGLNSSSYKIKKNTLNSDGIRARSEVETLETEQATMKKSLLDLQSSLAALEKERQELAAEKSKDAKLSYRIRKQRQKLKKLSARKLPKKESSVDIVESFQEPLPREVGSGTYVYVFSGNERETVEEVLVLEKWLESYGVKYIQARWDGLDSSDKTSGSMIKLMGEMEREIKSIPADSKIILIGYGLGGGAAIYVATEIAVSLGRSIEYLVVLDPMGIGGYRLNIVFETETYCHKKISEDQYSACFRDASRRKITSNVKNFYNRWQVESKLPLDAKEKLNMITLRKEFMTGKFLIESNVTAANQKRVYYGDEAAHQFILKDAAKDLPSILAPHFN